MGTITFTPKQQIIFDEVKNSTFIKQSFYFTGGTALSAVYLHHRESEDLDFFSPEKFDTLPILNLMTEWSRRHNFKLESQEMEVVRIFLLQFSDREKLKVVSFENLPKMLVPLNLSQLQDFYKELAKKLGKEAVD